MKKEITQHFQLGEKVWTISDNRVSEKEITCIRIAKDDCIYYGFEEKKDRYGVNIYCCSVSDTQIFKTKDALIKSL